MRSYCYSLITAQKATPYFTMRQALSLHDPVMIREMHSSCDHQSLEANSATKQKSKLRRSTIVIKLIQTLRNVATTLISYARINTADG